MSLSAAFAEFRFGARERAAWCFLACAGAALFIGLTQEPRPYAVAIGASAVGMAPSLMGIAYLREHGFTMNLSRLAVGVGWTLGMVPFSMLLALLVLVAASAIVGIDPFSPMPPAP
jgi:hypothetical protein